MSVFIQICFKLIFFAVCNEVPEQAVVSPVSGAIFERRLIEKFIAEHGSDPTNNKDLAVEQLIEIKGELLVLIMNFLS